HSPGDVKVTLPTANQFPAIYYKKGISDKIYPTYSDFLWDIVPIIKAEIQALVQEGAQYVQIDAPRYSYYIDPKWHNYVKNEMGLDPEQALDEAIRVDNACLEDARRPGVTLEDLALSPQCGFASTMEGNLLTEDQQWQKLKLVVDTARKVWGKV